MIVTWLLLIGSAILSWAGSPWPDPVGRASSDRDADLIAKLIQAGRLDDAETVCQEGLRGADPESDAAAKWTIWHSQVLVARQMESASFDEAAVQLAEQPIAQILTAYPQHPRRLFLETQRVAVEQAAARFAALAAAVAPAGGPETELAFTRLLKATTRTESLAQEVGEARAALDSERSAKQFAWSSDLTRLQQELQVDVVSMAVMQTEFFPAGSDDCIAAATKAEQAADQAVTKLPADSPARREVARLRIEAILRAGQHPRADSELAAWVASLQPPIPAAVESLRVRVDLATERYEQAQRRLDAFFGSAAEDAPRSLEMDLARLEYLIKTNRSAEVGQWLDAIGRRGGAYAQRRAEAISLAHLRSAGNAHAVDPSLVAAQGRDWLRRGNPSRAGELLLAAALADADGERAIRHAGEAAAAFVAADRPLDAAAALTDVSIAKSAAAGAEACHLQAAVLVSRMEMPGVAAQVEQRLRDHLARWSQSDSAAAARQWLIQILRSQQRRIEAAEVATQLPIENLTAADVDHAIDLWRSAFKELPTESLGEASHRLQTAFAPLMVHETARRKYHHAAVLMLDRDGLAGLPDLPAGAGEPFLDALLRFRQYGTVSEPLNAPPGDLVEDVVWRLMQDGRRYRQLRKPIAQLVDRWSAGNELSLTRAERLLWRGNLDQAVEMLKQVVTGSANPAETMQQAAQLLESSDDNRSRDAAIAFWDQLASGTAQGSRLWHQAKLAAIGLLDQIGNKPEAARRAKYILLTTANMDEQWKQQYESFGR